MVGAILGAAIPAIASLWGAHNANKANKQEAERNRQFQAQQAATQSQRAVADLKAAGLNPALAYGAQAASPSGSQAQLQNEVEGAVSGAKAWKVTMDQLNMQKEQHASDLATKEVQRQLMAKEGGKLMADTNLSESQRNLNLLSHATGLLTQQPMVRQATAQALLNELQIPAMRNSASWEEFISGTPNKFLRGLGEAAKFVPKFKF